MEKYPAVLLVGPPGSGKSTLGKKLAAVTEGFHLTAGEVLKAIPPGSPSSANIQKYVNSGLLVPDEVVFKVIGDYISGLISTFRYNPSRQILFLDGIPRNVNQVPFVEDLFSIVCVVVLDCQDKQILYNRLSSRLSTEKRPDDTTDIIQQRIDIYQSTLHPILGKFTTQIFTFDFSQSKFDLFKNVFTTINEYIRK